MVFESVSSNQKQGYFQPAEEEEIALRVDLDGMQLNKVIQKRLPSRNSETKFERTYNT
jgi:hypothetical protein